VTRATTDGRLPTVTKVAYGVGGLSDSIKTFSFTTFLLFYYTTVLGLPGTLLAAAMAIGLVWDAAVDPVIGHLSDRANIRFGRRHAFMLAGSLLAGTSLFAVFNPPAGLSTGALFAWLMVSSLCLRSSNSLFFVPYFALGAELSTDYHERTSLSGYRAGAVLVGTLAASVTAFQVFLPERGPDGRDAKFVAGSYESMGATFAAAIAVAGLVATLGTLRDRYRLGSPSPALRAGPPLRRMLGDALRDRSFRLLLTSNSLSVMASAINAALTMHFLTYRARVGGGQSSSLYFAGFYVGAMAGVLTWVRVTRTVEKHRVYAAALFVSALVMSAGYWLIGEGRPLGTGRVPVLVVCTALAGFFGTAAAVIAPSMLADIAARDELASGHRREGVYFGFLSLGQQLAGGLAVLAVGLLVDRFAGLVLGQAEQSAATVERLTLVSNVLPAGILACAAVIALRYHLSRREVESVQRALADARRVMTA
jgi:GPH family glycoside/pentoside/hexuronide:cation symporter